MNELVLQEFSIRAIDNDTPDSPMPDTVQYTISWGDLHNRKILSHLELERGGQELEDYMLKLAFQEMCLKAWDDAETVIYREKYSERDVA